MIELLFLCFLRLPCLLRKKKNLLSLGCYQLLLGWHHMLVLAVFYEMVSHSLIAFFVAAIKHFSLLLAF